MKARQDMTKHSPEPHHTPPLHIRPHSITPHHTSPHTTSHHINSTHLLPGFLELVLHVDVGRGDEGVDAGEPCRCHRLRAALAKHIERKEGMEPNTWPTTSL